MEMWTDLILPSPVFSLKTEWSEKKNINLFIKRDDLIHPYVSGNKWRKLKYNLEKIKASNTDCIITFGGAFSNHIHALAAACSLLNLPSMAFIRGELDPQNPTLQFCTAQGMLLKAISREAYRLKEQEPEVREIIGQYRNPFILPEGGSNDLALYGVAGIIDEIAVADRPVPDYIVLAAGTGGTTAGLLSSDHLTSHIMAFSALKSTHLYDEIISLSKGKNSDKLTVHTDYHFGGYARWDDSLLDFIASFEQETGIPLDHVYNGKAMYGLMDIVEHDYFTPGTTILYLHTGGLQGKAGLEYLLKKKAR